MICIADLRMVFDVNLTVSYTEFWVLEDIGVNLVKIINIRDCCANNGSAKSEQL